MPLFYFDCQSCQDNVQKAIAPTWEAGYSRIGTVCGKCGGEMARAPRGPNTQVVERLDNGAMPRAVERLSDAERLFKERSRGKPPI